MNTTHLKTYAPRARRNFIEAVKSRAAKFGIKESKPVEMVVRDEVAIVYGEAFPKQVYTQRQGVLERIEEKGFEPTMEAMAYTWFNRLMALRYMELHGFLEHGYRVLSHPEATSSPEILQHARHVDLPGLDQTKVTELLLAGNRDEELYRMLLLAQCHALHVAMPFLFEPIDDATELLLPDNLLHSDSLIRKMVNEIPEKHWESIEVVGWLYQFYISEKKDQVIGKVVKSEDIPAATQLFTPNWIVKYMVQNSLGAQWLATYPDSPIKSQMAYYIEPAKQSEAVGAALAAITPQSLNPEELTLIDPASGSGHILVEAYELFKAIYLERGYRQRDVPQLILEKNLFGLDIDGRAAQLTGFALMMKGRADDRRLFGRGVKLNVMALVDSAGFDPEVLGPLLRHSDSSSRHSGESRNPESTVSKGDLNALKELFKHATTFGSLIQIPDDLATKLPALKQLSEATSQDLFVSEALKRLGPLVRQAELLGAQYDAVVANPPYMGANFQTPILKEFLKDLYKSYDKDFFSAFTCRNHLFASKRGRCGLMTPMVWMFLSSHEALRKKIINDHTLLSLVHLEYNASGAVRVPLCTFVTSKLHAARFQGSFVRLTEFGGEKRQGPKTLEAIRNSDCGWFYRARPDEFNKIPGSPVAYWISPNVLKVFEMTKTLGEVVEAKQGIATADNGRFLRLWHEVDRVSVYLGLDSTDEAKRAQACWCPYNKGGDFRKWYGNQEYLVNWKDGGRELAHSQKAVVRNPDYHFRTSVSWSDVTSSVNAFRWYPSGFLFDSTGHSAFPDGRCTREQLLCLCNNNFTQEAARVLNPTLHFHVGYFKILPAAILPMADAERLAGPLIEHSRSDWDAYERSWDFQSLPLLTASSDPVPTLESSYTAWITKNRDTIAEMKRLEEENNRLFINTYGLADELTPDVPIEQITLTVNLAYRYPSTGKNKLTEEEQWTRFRQDTMEELVSYAIGCMMGRYSLDAPGLIYAHSGNEGFVPSRYATFPADDDGIVPLTDTEWFDDDTVTRLAEFISVAWDPSHLEANLTFLADNLKPKANESSRETLRRYLCDSFFKDHLQTYKKRPIYWLFSSGKHKALQCLVYLHRYNEGTLARLRMDYCVPLLGRLGARIDSLANDIEAASTTAQGNKLRRESELRKKQLEELRAFDEKLRHYADQRISLDLDDGVKVNYGKFGDLLAEVKGVKGLKP